MKRDSRRESRRLSLIQGSMIDAVKGCFTESELNALRVVIRLTVEFGKNLEADRLDNYVAESVFSGMDSFTSLVHAYGGWQEPRWIVCFNGRRCRSLRSSVISNCFTPSVYGRSPLKDNAGCSWTCLSYKLLLPP
jgi:hypothetical protein